MAISKITEEWSTGDVISSTRLNTIQNTINDVVDFANDINFVSENNSSTSSGTKSVATTGYVTEQINAFKNEPVLNGNLVVGSTETNKNTTINGNLTIGSINDDNKSATIYGDITADGGSFQSLTISQESTLNTTNISGNITVGAENSQSNPQTTIYGTTNFYGNINLFGTLDIKNNMIDWSKIDNKPAATSSSLGLVKVGTGLSIDGSGTLNLSLFSATTNTLGAIKVGQTLSISNDGILDVPSASTTVKGIIQVGTGLNADNNGILNTNIASTTVLGAIKVGDNLTIENDGTLNAVGNVAASQGGITNTLVTNGDKYNWNKVASIIDFTAHTSANQPELYSIYGWTLQLGRVHYTNSTLTRSENETGGLIVNGSATIGNNLESDSLLVQGTFGIKDSNDNTVYLTASELETIKTACGIT